MKTRFQMSALSCLLLLAGCGTMSTGTGTTATDTRQAAAAVPSASGQWEYFSAAKTLGIRLASEPPQNLGGPVEITVTSEVDVELTADIRDVDSGKEIEDFPVTAQQEAGTWRLIADFPQSGRYLLTIFGKARSDPGRTFSAVARATLTVEMDSAIHWSEFAAFKANGFSAVSLPPRDVVDEATIVLATSRKIDLGWIVRNSSTREYVEDAVSLSTERERTTLTLSFVEAGSYELRLACKAVDAGDEAWQLIGLAKFAAAVSASAGAVPANWKVWPAFRKLGITVVSSTSHEAADEAAVVLTAAKDITLGYSFANKSTGKQVDTTHGAVEINKDGREHRITAFFPETGEYELGLFACPAGEKDYQPISRASFAAQVAPGPILPENWEAFPRFRRYAIALTSTPPRNVGEELEIVLSVPDGWKGSATLKEKGSSETVWTVASDIAGREQRISAVLPKSGDYELELRGCAASEQLSRAVARATFTATVNEGRSPYRLWRINGRWPRLPVDRVQDFAEQWHPFGGEYFPYAGSHRGVLTEDITIAARKGAFAFAKGTTVTFANMYSSGFSVDVLLAKLAKDATVALYGASIVFKAGSSIALDANRLSGEIAKDAKIAIDGNTLLAPKGSGLRIWKDGLSEAEMTGRPTFTVGGKVYECAGSVLVEDYGEPGKPLPVRIMTAKDYALKVGTTSFTLPSGSLITFARQRVARVVFVKDTKVTAAGAVETMPAGWGFQFDESGGWKKFKAE